VCLDVLRPIMMRHLQCLFLTPPSPSSTLFPYTPLFRSRSSARSSSNLDCRLSQNCAETPKYRSRRNAVSAEIPRLPCTISLIRRSEEHTSELQSRENLVCRLLLEKKNV